MSDSKTITQQPLAAGEPSMATRFVQGAFWSLVGTVGSRLSAFIGAVVVARVLGQVGFGELAMIQSTIVLLGTFAGFGIGMTATKYVAELRLQDPERIGRIIGLTYWVSWTAGGFMALTCYVAAPWLAATTINAPHLAPEIRLASLLLLISAGFGPQTNILSGFQAFRAVAKITWWQALASLPVTVALVWFFGLRGVIVALIVTALLGAVFSAWFLKHEYRAAHVQPNFRDAWRERAVLWGFSLPAFLSTLILTPTLWAAHVILARQPGGYAQLGLFNAAMQFNWMITALNTIAAPVSVSLLAEVHGQQDLARYERIFNLNLRLNWSLAIVIAFGVLCLSPWLIMVFGEKYRALALLLPLVICYAVIRLVLSINGQFFYSAGRMWDNFKLTSLGCFLILILSYYLVPLYLATGMVISFLVAAFLSLNFQLFIFYKILGKGILNNLSYCITFTIILILSALILIYKPVASLSVYLVVLLAVSAGLILLKHNFININRLFHQVIELFSSKIGILCGNNKH